MPIALRWRRASQTEAYGFDLLGAAELATYVRDDQEAREVLSKLPVLAGG